MSITPKVLLVEQLTQSAERLKQVREAAQAIKVVESATEPAPQSPGGGNSVPGPSFRGQR